MSFIVSLAECHNVTPLATITDVSVYNLLLQGAIVRKLSNVRGCTKKCKRQQLWFVKNTLRAITGLITNNESLWCHRFHSFCFFFLSCERFMVSSQVTFPHRAIQCLCFQFPVPPPHLFLRSSSSCLRLLHPRHFYPSLYFFFNNVFRRQSLRKIWPIQLALLPCFYCMWDTPFLFGSM